MTYPTVDAAIVALQGPDGIDCPQCGRIFRDACLKKRELAKRHEQMKSKKGHPWKMDKNMKYFGTGFMINVAEGLEICLICKENDNG